MMRPIEEAEERVITAARRVQRAIRDEGVSPTYHHHVMGRHAHEWPVLWVALRELVGAVEDVDQVEAESVKRAFQ